MSSGDGNDHEEAVSQLTAMGFELDQVQKALNVTNGNVDQAVNFLLSGGGGESNEPPAASQSNEAAAPSSLVLCETSQYNVENGRSSCTCIALMGAALFLSSPSPSEDIVTNEFLQNMIIQGVQAYQELVNNNTSNVEHLSAEEVLQSHIVEKFLSLQLQGDTVRQGVLSDEQNHPLGLQALLQSCVDDKPPNQWMAVLITKTPETVVVLLPPFPQKNKFILLDSHPRPGVDGSSARIHETLNGLVSSLQAIFPHTSLGPDIPEMMAIMYNSFDLYPLTWRE